MAVNVSPIQLADPGFPEMVERVLRETGASPQHIDLEITEGLLLRDDPKISRQTPLPDHRQHE